MCPVILKTIIYNLLISKCHVCVRPACRGSNQLMLSTLTNLTLDGNLTYEKVPRCLYLISPVFTQPSYRLLVLGVSYSHCRLWNPKQQLCRTSYYQHTCSTIPTFQHLQWRASKDPLQNVSYVTIYLPGITPCVLYISNCYVFKV